MKHTPTPKPMKENTRYAIAGILALSSAVMTTSCKPKGMITKVEAGTADKVYVPPGKHDEMYNVVSGGFSGGVAIYGLPSGRCFRQIPVFSQHPESGYGYSEETKPMLETSFGYQPWDDQHHVSISQTKGEHDGRWIFANANNTPRVARISLETFRTEEILEVPNSSGNHSSPFITETATKIFRSVDEALAYFEKAGMFPMKDLFGN